MNKTGIELIAQEREEQITKHGRTIEKDVEYNDNEQLSIAAEMLLASEHEEGIDSESYPDGWDKEICDKMLRKSYKERLIIAGALLAAELDRLNAIGEQPRTITDKELIKRFKEREKPESEKELLMKFMQWHSGDETMSAERTQEIEKIVDIWLSPEPIIDNKTASWYKALELSKKIHSGEYKIEDSFNKLNREQETEQKG